MAVSSDRHVLEIWTGETPDAFGDLQMDEIDIALDSYLDSDDAIIDDCGESFRTYTARQRIEIAREEKRLASAMSDFDDHYIIDRFDDDYAAKSSH